LFMIRRREFITLLGGGAAALPLAARAQQAAMPVVGFLGAASARGYAAQVTAFRKGLQEAGYVEGRNVSIEFRWAEDRYDRLPALATELVGRQVAVIATSGTAAAPAAKAATMTIPIVFVTSLDPVELGLVSSLPHPGGNLTGVTTLSSELGPKRLELLHEAIPKATLIAALVNPTYPATETQLRDLQAAARALGVQVHVLNASTEGDFDKVFATLVQLRVGGLVIAADTFFLSRSEQLAALSVRYAIPAIFQYREFAAAGGLLSYQTNSTDLYRTAGGYTGRILKGEKPADLPVQRITKVELIINMKTAKALNITFPLTLLGRADEVIE
jgi:putative ABC transport system substrate-binding protein